MVLVLIAKEREPEPRVSATPETVKQMVGLGLEVEVERGAGAGSFIADTAFEAAGAKLVDPAARWADADLVLRVRGPEGPDDPGVKQLKPGAGLIAFITPHKHLDLVRFLVEAKVSCLAMELVPRITRAQKMDALSSQANIAGYKAVLMAAARLPKYFPLLMTAAGTVKPARVVVMGAGVAGLSAIATARRLGAVVEASDIRPAAKEQVMSLGAKFIEPPALEGGGEGEGGYAKEVGADYLKRQQVVVAEHCAQADVVITTALVPGRPAPVLLTRQTVEKMRPGSIVVDLAVEAGGNCELARSGEDVVHNGVTILGESNIPGTMAGDASLLYARNVYALVHHLVKDKALVYDLEDEVTLGTLLTHDGDVIHAATRDLLGGAAKVAAKPEPGAVAEQASEDNDDTDSEQTSGEAAL